jgi:hypothetical protein
MIYLIIIFFNKIVLLKTKQKDKEICQMQRMIRKENLGWM